MGRHAVGILQRLRDFSERRNCAMMRLPARRHASQLRLRQSLAPCGIIAALRHARCVPLTAGSSLHPKVRQMHEYWLTPSGADFELMTRARRHRSAGAARLALGRTSVPSCPDVTGFDIAACRRFRFRLDGSNLVLSDERLVDMTGIVYLEEMPATRDDTGSFVTAIYQRVVKRRERPAVRGQPGGLEGLRSSRSNR